MYTRSTTSLDYVEKKFNYLDYKYYFYPLEYDIYNEILKKNLSFSPCLNDFEGHLKSLKVSLYI